MASNAKMCFHFKLRRGTKICYIKLILFRMLKIYAKIISLQLFKLCDWILYYIKKVSCLVKNCGLREFRLHAIYGVRVHALLNQIRVQHHECSD
jgi:hypothetical protein